MVVRWSFPWGKREKVGIPTLELLGVCVHILGVVVMKSFALMILTLLMVPTLGGTELGEAVKPLHEPTIENARLVLEKLDSLVAGGDPRTVTLGKKMHRSVKRIFTKEHKMNEGQKAAAEREVKAKQYDKNGRQWLKPNIHGRVNKLAASAAFRDARELRRESQWAQEAHSKEWAEEVADFERMLGDLKFSKEDEALLTLAGLLATIVKRTDWVDRPSLKYDESRIQFIRNLVANKDRWLTLATHAADAGELELSYDFYRRAGSDLGRFRVGAKLAGQLAAEGYPGSSINLWKRLGEVDRAGELQKEEPELVAEDFKPLEGLALSRNVAPACVRISTANGHETGFFYQEGGYVISCKWLLLNKEGEVLPVTVTLEDGQKFVAKVLGVSKGHDIAALKIGHEGHELLPLGDRKDLKPGLALKLFGFSGKERNIAEAVPCTVLAPMDAWNNQPTSRLALDASQGCRGGPVVDQRGRVLGIFLTSKAGNARSLEVGAIHAFVRQF